MTELSSFIKSKFTYETPEISVLMFEDDTNSIKCYLGHFEYSVVLLSNNTSHERLQAAKNFLSNIHGSMAISSFSMTTPKFVVGELNLPTIELPVTEFSAYEFATFMYYKVQAILGNVVDVRNFKFVAQAPIEVSVELDIESLQHENPMIDEESWVMAMNGITEEDSDVDLSTLDVPNPWWRRPTGELRDFFNNIDELDEEQVNSLVAFNIDLGIDLDEVNSRYEQIEEDTSLAKRMLAEYKDTGEIPRELLEEFQELADNLGFDLNELLESISDGSMFGNYDDDDGSIRTHVISALNKNNPTNDVESSNGSHNDQDEPDDPDDPKGPTVVRL